MKNNIKYFVLLNINKTKYGKFPIYTKNKF